MTAMIEITTLLGYLRQSTAKMRDQRKPSPNKQYSIADLVLSANVVHCLRFSLQVTSAIRDPIKTDAEKPATSSDLSDTLLMRYHCL